MSQVTLRKFSLTSVPVHLDTSTRVLTVWSNVYMFWSNTLPPDVFADESPACADARASLAATLSTIDTSGYWACETMSRIGDGWALRSCGDTLPNTHWHILSRDGMWVALRVHKIVHINERLGSWDFCSEDVRREHLRRSVGVSPVAESSLDLVQELTRHAVGLPGTPNDYPYGEIYASEFVLGVEGDDTETTRFLYSLGGLDATRTMSASRGLDLTPRKSGRPYLPV